jgi:hypothetical protein
MATAARGTPGRQRDYEDEHKQQTLYGSHQYESQHQDHEDDQNQEMTYVLTTSPTENEKYSSLLSLFDMRNDAAFCDVAFLVHGCLFRAHKVIVRFERTSPSPSTSFPHITISSLRCNPLQ